MSLRGYWRTLIVRIACKPAMRITKLTTSASTGRLMKRSVKDFMQKSQVRTGDATPSSRPPARGRAGSNISSFVFRALSFASRVHWVRIDLRVRRQIVVDRHRHSVSQFENSGAHNSFAGFQSFRNRHEIAARMTATHKLLSNHFPLFAGLFVFLFLMYNLRRVVWPPANLRVANSVREILQ